MKKHLKTLAALLLCLALPTSVPAYAEGDAGVLDGQALQTLVETYIDEHQYGSKQISVGYVYTETGDTWLYNEDPWYYSASCYKVPVMMLLAELESSGQLTRESTVNGLQLGYAEESILVHSNNDFAHMMMRYFGTEPECRELYQKYSDMPKEDYISDFYDYSYYNVRFLTDVFKSLYAEPERFPNIIDCLKRAQVDQYFHGRFYGKYEVAQKYGSYQEWDGDYYNNCAAIVYMPHPVIMVVMTEGFSSQDGNRVIGEIGALLEQYTLELDAELERKAAEEAERLRLEEEARAKAAAEAAAAVAEETPQPSAQAEPQTAPNASPEAVPDSDALPRFLLPALAALLAAALIAALILAARVRAEKRRKAERKKARREQQRAAAPTDDYAPRH